MPTPPTRSSRNQPAPPGPDFAAFHRLRHPHYRRYAGARIGDPARADRAVRAAFDTLAAHWQRTLRGPNPDHDAWQLLTAAVAAHTDTRDDDHPRRGLLHKSLPAPRADALILHYRLGTTLTLTTVADLMGVDAATVALDLVLAERALPTAVVRDLERADSGR